MQYFFIGLLSLLCSFFTSISCFAIDSAAFENETKRNFSHWIKEAMEHYEVPAVSIVVIRDYKIAWEGYYGVTNILKEQPVTDTTLFQAGSLSKPLTAMAVLKAVQSGKLQLDEDVNHFLQSWTVGESPFLKDEYLTTRALLSHSGGINVPGFIGYASSDRLPSLNDVLNGKPPANSPEIKVIQPPGDYLYSGGGYVILQQLLMDVYQRSFPDIMDTLVLKPLSMTHSTFKQQPPTEIADQIATPYRPGYHSISEGPHIYVAEAAAGLWTTPFDLAKFVISIQQSLHNNPYQILTPGNAKLMVEPEVDHMGLGFYVNMNRYGQPVNKGRFFMHSGQTEGYQSLIIASARDGCGAIIMTNMSVDGHLIMQGKATSDWRFINEVVQHIADMEYWP